MASALQNPNYRRRINMIARRIGKKGAPRTAKAAVAAWLKSRHLDKVDRPPWMQRPTKGTGKKGSNDLDEILASAKKSTPARRRRLARLKRAVAHEFQRQGEGYGGKSRYFRTIDGKWGKSKRRSAWAPRTQRSKAGAYITKSKWKKYAKRYPGRKLGWLGNYQVVDVSGVRDADARRFHLREERGGRMKRGYPGSETWPKSAELKGWKKKRAQLAKRKKATTKRRTRARKNGLALTNPKFGQLGSWFTGYALPIAVAGAAGGAIHALANFGPGSLSARLNEQLVKVPMAGDFVVTHLPNTTCGVLAGGLLGVAGGFTKGETRKYLLAAGGATIAVGAAMDAYNFAAAKFAARGADMVAAEDLGALALDNMGALALDNMGALALDNMGGLALDNFGDGMAYETAPLAGEQLYGQATLGDAYYSGADFSLGEGQALLNGSQVWTRKFGRPSRRTKRAAGSASHLAGRRGHRWGWLIKLIGFRRAGAIAAMKPKQRLSVIRSMRAGAIKGFQQATLEQRARAVQAATPPIEELVAKTSAAGHGQIAPQGAGGPCGPGGLELAYGDPALFMA